VSDGMRGVICVVLCTQWGGWRRTEDWPATW